MKRQLKNFFQYLYLNKMELSQPFKKRYLLGIWNWASGAAGFCIAGIVARTRLQIKKKLI